MTLVILWESKPIKLVFYHLPHGTDESHTFARMQVQMNTDRVSGYMLIFTQNYKGIGG
jgi:hypothetical protein